MLTIGLTGGSGAGKGAVCEILGELGVPTVDTDAVYREVAVPGSECLSELTAAFGGEILTDGGELDRRRLASLVFSDPTGERLHTLNRITHKYILDECRRRLAWLTECGREAAVVDAPQLYESGFHECCDAVVAVVADRELRLRRIMERDGVSREYAEERIAAQHDDDFFTRRADYVIENNGSREALRRRVAQVFAALTGREDESGEP